MLRWDRGPGKRNAPLDPVFGVTASRGAAAFARHDRSMVRFALVLLLMSQPASALDKIEAVGAEKCGGETTSYAVASFLRPIRLGPELRIRYRNVENFS